MNHYKDRNPQDTVKIIQKFFQSNGFTDSIDTSNPVTGLHWCRVSLFYNGEYVLGANGKGTTRKYALASGYAELYERFCNRAFLYCNPIVENFRKANTITKEELYRDKNINEILHSFCNSEESIDKNLKCLCGESIKVDEYVNIQTLEKKYYNIGLIDMCCGTTGLAAGNTFEEAFVQGLSEIFERYTSFEFITNRENISKVKLIRAAALSKDKQNLYKDIESAGNKIFVLDLSYLMNTPVVGILIFNLLNSKFYTVYGCAPVFELALERCFTELYQGEFQRMIKKGEKIQGYRNIPDVYYQSLACMCSKNGSFFPEEVLINLDYVDDYNREVFLDDSEWSNVQLLEYYKNLLIKNNLNVYYHDSSLCDNMCALSLYCPDLNWAKRFSGSSFLGVNKEINECKIKAAYNFYKYIRNVLNHSLTSQDINDLIDSFKSKYDVWDYNISTDLLSPIIKQNYSSQELLYNFVNDIYVDFLPNHNRLYWIIHKYILYCEYICGAQYTNEEIKKLFNTIDIMIINEEIAQIQADKNFVLLERILPNVILQLYKEQGFLHIMQILYNGVNI